MSKKNKQKTEISSLICKWCRRCCKLDSIFDLFPILQGLLLLHRRAARLIVRNHCSDAALQSLAMESLENRRKKHVYRSVIKCMNGKFPQFFINYFNYNRDITGRQTRQSNLLHLPRVRTEAAKKSFFYFGAQIFNYFKNM